MNMPFVTKTDYTLVGINEEGYLTLLDDDDETKEDLQLPTAECHQEFVQKFMADYDDEKDLICSVTKSMGVEMVLDYKIDTT